MVGYFESAEEISGLEVRVEGTGLWNKAIVCEGRTRNEVF